MSHEARRGLPEGWEGRSEEEWRAVLGVPELELYESLPSTNGRLLARAASGADPFTVIIAGAQTQGRGRGGRAWYSPEGGLWLSVLLPIGGRGEVGVLPLAVGVAAAVALESFVTGKVGLKWPNDLLLDDRKVGGILCEAVRERADVVVAGIGVNLRRPSGGYPAELDPGIAILEEEGSRAAPASDLARMLIEELKRRTQPAPVLLCSVLREEWTRRDRLQGCVVRLDTGALGTVTGVSEDGSLELSSPGGKPFRVRGGSVRLEEPGRSPALHRVGESPGRQDDPVGTSSARRRKDG